MNWRGIIATYLICACVVSPAAIHPRLDGVAELQRLSEGKDAPGRPSVYAFGDATTDNLVPVRVLGAVGQSGLHYVPADLDLLTLISIAGGTSNDAKLDSITINRVVDGKRVVLTADLEDLLKSSDAGPITVRANDTIYVPAEKPVISDNLAKTVSLFVGLASIALSIVIIAKR